VKVKNISGWNYVDDYTFTKKYYDNIIEPVDFEGKFVTATGSVTVNIDWIDKDRPAGEITYDPDGPALTAKVIAILQLNMTGQVLTSGWVDSGNGMLFTKEYTENVSGEIVVFESRPAHT
jgi:hypothetical protein